MKILNYTHFDFENALKESVTDYPVDGLVVEIRYCPSTSRRYASGTYYRQCKGYMDGRFIKLRLNKLNKYPVQTTFKTSDYERKTDRKGNVTIYQKLKKVSLADPKALAVALFLHEFSHYLDHMQGLNGKYKQTKADKFAMDGLERMGLLQEILPSKNRG